MSTCNIRNLDLFSFSKARREKHLGLLLDGPRLPLVIAHFESAFISVESDSVALDRHESIERITHVRAVRILHERRHRGVDVAVFAKRAAITMIVVYVFATGVERHAVRIRRHVVVKATLRLVRTLTAICRAELSIASINLESCARGNFDRICIEPPVNQVEVMRRLVHPETAALGLEAMPATEVVGAVVDVEIPTEIDGQNAADGAGRKQLLDLLVFRRVTILQR